MPGKNRLQAPHLEITLNASQGQRASIPYESTRRVAPGGLGLLSGQLLISVQAMIPGAWDQAPRQAPR